MRRHGPAHAWLLAVLCVVLLGGVCDLVRGTAHHVFNMANSTPYLVFVDDTLVGQFHTWYQDGGLHFSTPPDGTYTVRIVAAADTTVSSVPTDPAAHAGAASAFPNPCGEYVSFWIPGECSLELFSVQGVRVYSATIRTAGVHTIRLDVPAGVYFWRRSDGATGRIVKIE